MQMLREDHIDILVDEVMHMGSNRLRLYARRPVPVVLTWLAYPGTTGVGGVQYRLTDPYLDPPGSEAGKYSEESIRLPDTFLCYGPTVQEPPADLPAAWNGFVTFGSLCTPGKLNARMLETWARLLSRVQGSRLIMVAPPGKTRERLTELFARAGVAQDRVEFVGIQSHDDYMATYHRIDIGLDTFPYSGFTTGFDAFWMGVPVVTIVGDVGTGRGVWSVVNNLKLTELGATDQDDYIRIAGELASDLPRLRTLRATLRKRMLDSPLVDHPRFTKGMEATYRQLWQRWCEAQR
jgi:predicted O-linked N-acetylglucosamine transferase (SPINDLY family)